MDAWSGFRNNAGFTVDRIKCTFYDTTHLLKYDVTAHVVLLLITLIKIKLKLANQSINQ